MKRISVVTWYYSNNFGTALQAFALQKYLVNCGYKVELLNHFQLNKSFKSIIKSIAGRLGLLKIVRCVKYSNSPLLRDYIDNEIRERYVFSQADLTKLLVETDAFVTGSDQIWNTYFCFDPFYFLSFVKGKKKIAYASSIGTDGVNPVYEEKVANLLNDFYRIGVREETAVIALSEVTGRDDIRQVLDPTFLIDSDTWLQFGDSSKSAFTFPKKYIFCYLIGNNKVYYQQLKDVASKVGVNNVIVISSIENYSFIPEGATVLRHQGPKEFIRLIAHASLVCTDSFHATALSINLNKDFVEFKRFEDAEKKSQNSRIYDMLGHFGLMSRLYESSSSEWAKSINYHDVNDILSIDRKFSGIFLRDAIEK